jgi:hypothetical protein
VRTDAATQTSVHGHVRERFHAGPTAPLFRTVASTAYDHIKLPPIKSPSLAMASRSGKQGMHIEVREPQPRSPTAHVDYRDRC